MIYIPEDTTALYISHGGGPLPLLGDDAHKEMTTLLTAIAAKLSKPQAILVVSAHWEENVVTITRSPNPPMIYDYYGFPKQAYEIQYPAPGAPELVDHVHGLLKANSIEARLDEKRGFDHGLYVPLLLMYPQADIPCIQVSLLASLDAEKHIHIGEALSKLTQDGVLIIGSGFSFHNMQAFTEPVTTETRSMNQSFEKWLIDTCSRTAISEEERTRKLAAWDHAQYARYCHPREEHLLPLHVCYGTAKRACSAVAELTIMNRNASFYAW